ARPARGRLRQIGHPCACAGHAAAGARDQAVAAAGNRDGSRPPLRRIAAGLVMKVRAAVVQAAPAPFDRARTLDRVETLAAEAARFTAPSSSSPRTAAFSASTAS